MTSTYTKISQHENVTKKTINLLILLHNRLIGNLLGRAINTSPCADTELTALYISEKISLKAQIFSPQSLKQ